MQWWEAIILGLVEGLTEYLPVSSTGHLLVTQRLLGIGNGGCDDRLLADGYAICIQVGAIVAVLSVYWPRLIQMLRGLAGRDTNGKRLAVNMVVAFVPAGVMGLLVNDAIEHYLFGMWPVVFAWFIGGVAILLVAFARGRRASDEKTGRGIDAMTWQMALLIGLAQCIAIWPGTSRSLVTIVAALLVGLHIVAAVEFSFLLGVITLTAATVKKAFLDQTTFAGREMMLGQAMIEHYGALPVTLGLITAFVAAVIAVKWMVAYLKSHGLQLFGWYRIAIALLVATLLLTDVMATD